VNIAAGAQPCRDHLVAFQFLDPEAEVWGTLARYATMSTPAPATT
jgi:hypothetical protein